MQVGVLANYELAHSQWVELLQFILAHCQSAQQNNREVYVLCSSSYTLLTLLYVPADGNDADQLSL